MKRVHLVAFALAALFLPAPVRGAPIQQPDAGATVVQADIEDEIVPTAFPPAQGMRSIRTQKGGLVTINLKNAPLQDVLEMVSEKTGRKFVPKPDTKVLMITAYLPDVPLDAALQAILTAYDLELTELESGIVLVSRKEKPAEGVAKAPPLVTELVRLRHLEASDVKETLEPLLGSGGKITVVKFSGHTGWAFGEPAEGGEEGSGFAARERLETGYRKEVSSQLLIISDTAENLEFLKSIIAQIDVRPKQVLISTKIVEVSRDKLRDVGFDWAMRRTGRRLNLSAETVTLQERPGIFNPRAQLSAVPDLTGVFPYYDSGGTLFLEKLSGHEFEVLIHALEEEVGANVLSTPQILTLTNQEAVILVGTRFPILETNISGGDTPQVTTSLEYYENIGILLNVVPQIQDETYINMIIHPVVSALTGYEEARGTGNVVLARYPVIDVRETETQILIEDGQTIAIGGLLKDVESESVIGVPVLRHIPLIGRLFERKTRDTEKVELIIFLSASIVAEPGEATEEKLRSHRVLPPPPAEEGPEAE